MKHCISKQKTTNEHKKTKCFLHDIPEAGGGLTLYPYYLYTHYTCFSWNKMYSFCLSIRINMQDFSEYRL